MSRVCTLCVLVVCSVCASDALAGPIWPEGSAGRLPFTAEVVVGGPMSFINGELTGSPLRGVEPNDYEDMYLIRIRSPEECGGRPFSASTDWFVQSGGINDFNTQLWLFNAAGMGLLGNDDVSLTVPQSFITFPATDITLQPFPGPGLYYLAISGFDDDPVSSFGPIFNQASTTEISGPDGPGALFNINDWSATGDGETGQYSIRLECAGPVPEPGSGLLFLGTGLAFLRRRHARI